MKIRNFIILLFAIVLISACGKKADTSEAASQSAAASASETAGTAAAAETEAEITAAAETEAESAPENAGPESGSNDNKESEAADKKAESSEHAETESGEEPGSINDHYGYFVKFGDRIYFRRPGADAMKGTALFGRFLSQMLGSSKIMSYDTKTGEVIFENNSLGYGPMAAAGDFLYLSEYDYPNDIEVETFDYLNLTNGDYIIGCGEKLAGVAADGRWAVSFEFITEEDKPVYRLYYTNGRKTEEIKSSGMLEFIGAGSNMLIYREYGEDKTVLWRCNMETDELLMLGELPAFEDLSPAYSGEAEGFAFEDGKIAAVFAAYDGTGHFYAGSHIVTADVNKKNSLEWVDSDYSSDYYHDEMNRGPGVVFEDGQAVPADGMPYSVEVDNRSGELILFDENGKAGVIASGYRNFESDEEGTVVDIELAEYVGGKIYAVRNEMHRAEEDDIGWRWAYERKFTYFVEIDPETGEEKIIDSVLNSAD